MGEGEGKALATQTTSLKSTEHEAIRRSDIDALIKALKDNGNSFGNPLGYFLAAYRTISFLSKGGGIDSITCPFSRIGAGVVEEPEGWAKTSGTCTGAVFVPTRC
ncbi:hypothetical protein F2Q68_00044094 [Brassica cretica]|uniref:Uncharacterized protein n=1 Tax=Brassica cretica TaxID=69181 RepID=A0A8S9LSX6_BRACR|nr:hypothetical protein F2Q68_00044094 [Brassica cretica]